MDGDRSTSDILKILVATDTHLGFAEKEPGRADDSFDTFEEILSLAKEKDVDFILLGGDLFHENKPSRYCLHKCIDLLKKHTFGDKQIQFEVINERDKANVPFLPCQMNFEDPNLNISYPVFSIHGNHDDPTGRDCLCSLDLLSAMGLVNHFGKCLNLEQVEIKPLLFQKGGTKLALYGLGAIRDQRLHRIFREGKVSMIRPSENSDEWCNLLVVHQNRARHSETGYLPEEFLEGFIDLVIWGHEHECLIVPQKSGIKDFFISQPGSSVATSLSPGEAVKKQVGILHVHGCEFWMEEIPLRTVRPFCIEDISLQNSSLKLNCDNPSAKILEYCKTYVERMIESSADLLTGHSKQPTIPLIRLRVEYDSDDQTFSNAKFGQYFLNKVANAKDIILFQRKRQIKEKMEQLAPEDMLRANENDLKQFSAIDIVRRHFESSRENQKLQMLTEKGLGSAVQEFVDKKETEAIATVIKHQKQKTADYLIKKGVTENTIAEELTMFIQLRLSSAEEDADVTTALKAAKQLRIDKGEVDSEEEKNGEDMEGDDDDEDSRASTSSGKGRGRGTSSIRSTTRGRGRGRGRGSKSTDANESWNSTKRATSNEKRGRGKDNNQQPTISSIFGKRTNQKKIPTFEIEDSSDEDIADRSSKRRKTNTSLKSSNSIRYDDDDDDEVMAPNF